MNDGIPHGIALTFLQLAGDSGAIGSVGIILLLFSIVLCVTWILLAIQRRRRSILLGFTAIILAACGYVGIDFIHVWMNLRMLTEGRAVREDCKTLFQRTEWTDEEYFKVMNHTEAGFPVSFARLGVRQAQICRGMGVYLVFREPNPLGIEHGWGIFHVPYGSAAPVIGRFPYTSCVRSSWHHDFYECRARNEM